MLRYRYSGALDLLVPGSAMGGRPVMVTTYRLPADAPDPRVSFPGKLAVPCFFHAVVPPVVAEESSRKPEMLRNSYILSRVAVGLAVDTLSEGNDCLAGPEGRLLWDLDHPWLGKGDCSIGISLSHEDYAGAAVVWGRVRSSDSKRGASAEGLGMRFAVDVVDVASVHGLSTRYPKFASRMLPQCLTRPPGGVSSEVSRLYERDGACDACHFLGATQGSDCSSSSSLSACAELHSHDHWWCSAVSADHRVFLEAVILAQHWSIRECCVKLVGVRGRSFSYRSLQAAGSFCTVSDPPFSPGSAVLPRGLLRPYQVYAANCQPGADERALRRANLRPTVTCVSWMEWLPCAGGTQWAPLVLTVAAAPEGREA